MITELKEIQQALETLLKDLDIQLAAISTDSKTFHSNLINLLSEFPDDKELIQFIVYINDRLETNQTISKDIFMDSIRGVIKQKLILIKRLIREEELLLEIKSTQNTKSKIQKILQFVTENKTTVIIISVTLSLAIVFSSLYINPKDTMETLKIIGNTTKGVSK
jgi:hypothetical protein